MLSYLEFWDTTIHQAEAVVRPLERHREDTWLQNLQRFILKKKLEEALDTRCSFRTSQETRSGLSCLDCSFISREAEYINKCKKTSQLLWFDSMLNHGKGCLYGQSLQAFTSIHDEDIVVSS